MRLGEPRDKSEFGGCGANMLAVVTKMLRVRKALL
jgi:hypothetical protein